MLLSTIASYHHAYTRIFFVRALFLSFSDDHSAFTRDDEGQHAFFLRDNTIAAGIGRSQVLRVMPSSIRGLQALISRISFSARPSRLLHTVPAPAKFSRDSDEARITVERELGYFQRSLQSDASSRILASPLRRCSVTQIILPRLLMFRMISHRPLKSIESEEAEVDRILDRELRDHVKETAKERHHLLRRRSRRRLLKDKRKSTINTLLRAQRMAQHKLVTSQTDISRDRYRGHVASIKARIKESNLPPPLGYLLPFGLSRDSERKSIGLARGRGLWCSLNKKVVAASTKMTTHRLLSHTHPAPHNLPELLQEGLEVRAVEEAQFLRHYLTIESCEDSIVQGLLIRRLRGQEMTNLVQHGVLKLKDDADVSLACLLCSNGSLDNFPGLLPVYRLDTMFVDETRRTAFLALLRDIAILINRKQLRLQRQVKPSISKMIESSANQKDVPASADFNDGRKMPRVHLIRRDERTVNLCIALWRLHAWCQSG